MAGMGYTDLNIASFPRPHLCNINIKATSNLQAIAQYTFQLALMPLTSV